MKPTAYASYLLLLIGTSFFARAAFASDVSLETGIIDAFRTLKYTSYAIVVIAALVGAGVFTYMHKRLLSFDRWFGLGVCGLLAVILFYASASRILDDTADVCWVITDANEQLMLPCAQGRENIADLIGLKSLYVAVSPRDILAQGMPEPIGPAMINFMIYGSLLLSSLGLCLFFQWISKNFIIGR